MLKCCKKRHIFHMAHQTANLVEIQIRICWKQKVMLYLPIKVKQIWLLLNPKKIDVGKITTLLEKIKQDNIEAARKQQSKNTINLLLYFYKIWETKRTPEVFQYRVTSKAKLRFFCSCAHLPYRSQFYVLYTYTILQASPDLIV